MEELFFNVAGAAEGEGFFRLGTAATTAVGIWIPHMGHARNQGRKAALLLRFGRGERERSHRPAMECAEEGDDLLALGVITGDFQGAFNGFCAGIAIVKAVRPGHWSNRRKPFGKGDQAFVIKIGAGNVDQLGSLLLDRRNNFRMAMAGRGDRDSGREIEEFVAVDVFDAKSAAAFGDHGIRTRVAGRHQAVVACYDRFGFGTGKRPNDLRRIFRNVEGRWEFKYLLRVQHFLSSRWLVLSPGKMENLRPP